MSSVNKVIILGNLTKDPIARDMHNGKKVVSFNVATSDVWKDKQTGERKEKSEYHNIVIFNEGIAKIAELYLKKGSQVYIEGALQTRKWTDTNNGVEKYITEIVLKAFNGVLQLLDKKPVSATTEDSSATDGKYVDAAGDELFPF